MGAVKCVCVTFVGCVCTAQIGVRCMFVVCVGNTPSVFVRAAYVHGVTARVCSMRVCAAYSCATWVCAVHGCSVPEGVQRTSVCSVHLCNTRVRTEHAWAMCPLCREPTPPSPLPPPCPVPSPPPLPQHPGPSAEAAHAPALGAALRTPCSPHSSPTGPSLPRVGMGHVGPGTERSPPPETPALGSRNPPGSLQPRSAHTARPGRRGSGHPRLPRTRCRLSSPAGRGSSPWGLGDPLTHPGSGEAEGIETRRGGGWGPPSGHSSPPSPCKQGASGRRKEPAAV